MASQIFSSAEFVEFRKTVSGALLFGDQANSDWSNSNFENDDDYDVFVMGNGYVDPDSFLTTGLDYTVTAGTLVIRVFPKKPNAIGQVS